MSDYVLVQVRDFPLELRTALATQAEERNVPMGRVAVEILADACHMPDVVNDMNWRQHYRGSENVSDFSFRMPPKLHRKTRMEAARNGATVRGIVISILSAHYGLGEQPATRRTPERA